MTVQAQAGLSPALSLPLSLHTALTFGNSFGAPIALATIAARWQAVIDHMLQLQTIAGIQLWAVRNVAAGATTGDL